MKGQSQKVIQFSKQFIRKTNLYFVHEATVNGEKCLAKLFNQEIIQKYGLDEALEYQMEVFNETSNTIFPQYFMHLEAASTVNNAVITITKYYDLRLDQLIRKGPLNQKQAMQIFQNILKATYSLVMEGYSHRNMRPQHFVKAGNLWKLESVVYEENVNSKGLSCQYVANAEYHPPQAYKRPNFTEEELDRRIVWDLGCILISMILGGHRLKNQAILEKFKNQPFSFSAIGAKAGQKTSKQLQEMIGKMCHYNENKRMTFPQLLMSGFFSKQVAAHYKKYKENKKSKIFVGSNSSLSQSLSSRGQKQTAQQIQLPPSYNNWVANDQKKEYEYSTHGNNDKIATDMDFKKKVDIIIEQQFESSSIMNKTPLNKKISDINNEEYDAILNVYKNYLDKGEILSIGGRKFQKMLKLFGDVNIGREIVEITQYALKFVQVMDLCKLAKAMNQNKEFFEFNKKSWEAFHGSKEYKAIREIVNSKKNIQSKVLQEYRNRLIGKNKNRFVVDKNHLKDFVEEYSPEDLSYKDIKQPYRKILKVSYDTIAEHYSTNKTEEWAQLGMYITFCIAIDKFYIPEDFKSNFKFYFAWSKKQPCNYVSLVDFQDYLDHAPRIKLVQNSRYIMQKYFDV